MTEQDTRPQRPFAPTSGEVRATRSLLASLGLATELVLQILDHAHYWTVITTEQIHPHPLAIVDEDWDDGFSAVEHCLTVPLHLGAHPDGEVPRIREVEFIVVSHDQGWTTEREVRPYETSSWFEVSHCRPRPGVHLGDWPERVYENIEQIRRLVDPQVEILARPSQEMEPMRKHCPQMMKVTWPRRNRMSEPALDEGTHTWWLQGNQVARSLSVFEGEMVKRYRVVWGCKDNPRWEGNEGAGRGEGFVDGLQEGDLIAVWARAKRRGWENHVFGVRVIVRYTI